VTRVKWKLVLVHLEIVLISMHDRCMVCVERNHGFGNHFGVDPMVLLRDVSRVETHFGPLGDTVNLDAR
jgi:hypothetical protein